jgi:hypothetical protein
LVPYVKSNLELVGRTGRLDKRPFGSFQGSEDKLFAAIILDYKKFIIFKFSSN